MPPHRPEQNPLQQSQTKKVPAYSHLPSIKHSVRIATAYYSHHAVANTIVGARFRNLLLATSACPPSAPPTRVCRARPGGVCGRAIGFCRPPESATNAWQLSRAAYDWAEFATTWTKKAPWRRSGLPPPATARARPRLRSGHYYLP